MYNNLYLEVSEKPRGINYHYIITSGATSHTAFKTEQGYKNYLERTGLTPEFQQTVNSREHGKVDCYKLHGQYNEKYFRSMEEIPQNAKRYVGVSNGSYVDCYHADVDGVRTMFLPNSNEKEVYKPKDYHTYSKLN